MDSSSQTAPPDRQTDRESFQSRISQIKCCNLLVRLSLHMPTENQWGLFSSCVCLLYLFTCLPYFFFFFSSFIFRHSHVPHFTCSSSSVFTQFLGVTRLCWSKQGRAENHDDGWTWRRQLPAGPANVYSDWRSASMCASLQKGWMEIEQCFIIQLCVMFSSNVDIYKYKPHNQG